MKHRFLASVAFVATVLLVPGRAVGQTAVDSWIPPLTAWGDRDIQGIFSNKTITSLERPDELAGQEFLTEEQAGEFEAHVAADRADADD